jgi:hypothetical protein
MRTGALVPRRSTCAGVPGPRRSADECDAGWFAPVATRRRSSFSGKLLLPRGDRPRRAHARRQPPGQRPGFAGWPRPPRHTRRIRTFRTPGHRPGAGGDPARSTGRRARRWRGAGSGHPGRGGTGGIAAGGGTARNAGNRRLIGGVLTPRRPTGTAATAIRGSVRLSGTRGMARPGTGRSQVETSGECRTRGGRAFWQMPVGRAGSRS